MRIRRALVAVAASAGALAGLAVTAAPASAAPTGLPATQTLCGGGIGGGVIEAYYDPNGNFQKANPTIWIRPQFAFVPLAPNGYCGAEVTLHWRNLDKGTFGMFPAGPVPVGDNTPFSPNTAGFWVPLTPPTGKGRVEVTIVTNLPNIPATGSFVVS